MVFDLILLLVLLYCILSGYRKGLIMSLCTLLVLVLSCLGAAAAQEVLTPRAVEWMEPKMTAYVSEKIQDRLAENTDQALEDVGDAGFSINGQDFTLSDMMDLLKTFGVDVEEKVQSAAEEVSEPLADTAARAASEAILEAVAGSLIFAMAFLVIYLVLHSLALAVNLADRLPVVHTLNRAGGAVIGVLSGAFFLTMAMALLVSTGLLSSDALSGPVARAIRSVAARLV